MARNKNMGCVATLLLMPFYLIWETMKMSFIVLWEVVKLPYTVIKGLSKDTYQAKKKGISGYDYERFVARYLNSCGYNAKTTQRSGDYGVDIVATKGGNRYAVQCKYYSYPVGVEAVQQVVGGMAHYHCNKAMVITNSTFTEPAKTLAAENGVKLKASIEYGHINRLKIARDVLMLAFTLLMIGMLVSISETGIRGIPREDKPAYLAIILIFSALFLSVIIPKITRLVKYIRLKSNVKKLVKDVDAYAEEVKAEANSAVYLTPEEASVDPDDPIEEQAISYILQTGLASTSALQRRFNVGYMQAARLLDYMESQGMIGPRAEDGSRAVKMRYSDWIRIKWGARNAES